MKVSLRLLWLLPLVSVCILHVLHRVEEIIKHWARKRKHLFKVITCNFELFDFCLLLEDTHHVARCFNMTCAFDYTCDFFA